MKKNEIPRYGKHDGIKYSPRRTIVRICEYCGSYFEVIGREMAGQKYCSINCADNIHLKQKKENIKNNRPSKEEESERIRKGREAGKYKTTSMKTGSIQTPGKPQSSWTDEEWMNYHKKWNDHKKFTLKQEY